MSSEKSKRELATILSVDVKGYSRLIVEEDTTYPPFLSDALAPLMRNGKAEKVREAGHSVYFQRVSVFNQLVD